jgi:hypothetical protein
MPHRKVGHFFYNIFPSCSNCSSSEAETRILCVYVPLGFARGAMLGSAQTVRRAKPRREIQCIYTNPTASLGVHSALLGVPSAPLGVQCSAPLGVQPSAPLGVQSQQPHRVDIIITTLELLSWYR